MKQTAAQATEASLAGTPSIQSKAREARRRYRQWLEINEGAPQYVAGSYPGGAAQKFADLDSMIDENLAEHPDGERSRGR